MILILPNRPADTACGSRGCQQVGCLPILKEAWGLRCVWRKWPPKKFGTPSGPEGVLRTKIATSPGCAMSTGRWQVFFLLLQPCPAWPRSASGAEDGCYASFALKVFFGGVVHPPFEPAGSRGFMCGVAPKSFGATLMTVHTFKPIENDDPHEGAAGITIETNCRPIRVATSLFQTCHGREAPSLSGRISTTL